MELRKDLWLGDGWEIACDPMLLARLFVATFGSVRREACTPGRSEDTTPEGGSVLPLTEAVLMNFVDGEEPGRYRGTGVASLWQSRDLRSEHGQGISERRKPGNHPTVDRGLRPHQCSGAVEVVAGIARCL